MGFGRGAPFSRGSELMRDVKAVTVHRNPFGFPRQRYGPAAASGERAAPSRKASARRANVVGRGPNRSSRIERSPSSRSKVPRHPSPRSHRTVTPPVYRWGMPDNEQNDSSPPTPPPDTDFVQRTVEGSELTKRAMVFPSAPVEPMPISEIVDSAGPVHGSPVEAAPPPSDSGE